MTPPIVETTFARTLPTKAQYSALLNVTTKGSDHTFYAGIILGFGASAVARAGRCRLNGLERVASQLISNLNCDFRSCILERVSELGRSEFVSDDSQTKSEAAPTCVEFVLK